MRRRFGLGERGLYVVSPLTAFALSIHGYHPYAEDGGLYVAGVKRLLDPALFGTHAEFVTEPLRFSLFAPVLAKVVRASHMPLEWVLFGLYGACVWATLYAGWMIAARCTSGAAGRRGAAVLLACWLTLPVAGTSLMLMDPYVTARSLTAPLLLVAIAWTMDAVGTSTPRERAMRGAPAVLAMMVAVAMHPLMAGYGVAALALLLALGLPAAPGVPRRRVFCLCVAAVAIAAVVQMGAPAESSAYVQVERTRYYWFLSQWKWYELLGLAAPLLLLWGLASKREKAGTRLLARTTLLLGFISTGVAAGFAHIGYTTHLVARLQPLRCFQTVYLVMILLLGIWLGERVLRNKLWRWVAAMALFGVPMFLVQRQLYGASEHFEWPGLQPRNSWVQAFVWARGNTPKEAMFAMEPHYIQAEGEDAQCFRAIAERDALPDYSKDGGEASIMPALTDDWMAGQAAQAGIGKAEDAEREASLKPLGVTWVVLKAASSTEWTCPYANGRVKVCSLP